MHCDLLINSRSRQSKRYSAELFRLLERNGIIVDQSYVVAKSYPLEEALDDIISRKPRLLLIAGGDGTLSTTLNALADTPTEVGILPLGTTNNFARSLGLSLDLEEAVRSIVDGSTRPVDLGHAGGIHFTNVASVGLSAQIAGTVTNKAKRRWGRTAYALAGVRALVRHKPFVATISDAHDDLRITVETHQIVIANGRFHAGREIAEDAAIDDGLLIVFALGGPSKISFIKHMLDFYLGPRRDIVHTSYLVAKNVKIITSTSQPIEFDGEVKAETPANFSVIPAAISVRHKK